MKESETQKMTEKTYAAFEGQELIAQGSLADVASKVKQRMGGSLNCPALIFNDETGNVMDFNFQGSEQDVRKRLEVFTESGPSDAPENTGPGRPRLGVVSREVSLLPRQWEWLASQSGGASATLRRLVDEARKKSLQGTSVRQAQDRTYKFLSVMAGDLPGFEEAVRALYRKDRNGFMEKMLGWPRDVKEYAMKIGAGSFSG
jgi:hypothetical protein